MHCVPYLGCFLVFIVWSRDGLGARRKWEGKWYLDEKCLNVVSPSYRSLLGVLRSLLGVLPLFTCAAYHRVHGFGISCFIIRPG